MSLPGRDDKEKLEALGNRTYKEQAIWYLNGFWKKGAEQQAERVWKYVHDAAKLDEKGLEGGILDEFQGLPEQSLLNSLYSISSSLAQLTDFWNRITRL